MSRPRIYLTNLESPTLTHQSYSSATSQEHEILSIGKLQRMNTRSSSCYCCNPRQPMDVDSALDELGMLSSVTNSRREYLRERIRTQSEPTRSEARSLQIVRLDKNYVNNISSGSFGTFYPTIDPGSDVTLDPNSPSSSFLNSENYRNHSEMTSPRKKVIRRSLMRKNRYKKPYEVPWRLDQTVPDIEIRQENCPGLSKSNSESPIKGVQSKDSLTRSRSLENIELARTRLLEIFEKVPDAKEKQDIENVSRNLECMHVSDTHS